MGEEKPAATKSSGMMGKLIALVVVVLIAAVGGLLTYKLVLAPTLDRKEPVKAEHDEEEDEETIPEGSIPFDLPEAQAEVRAEDPNMPNSILMYSVSLVCANEETHLLVEKNKQWFISMLADLHRGRTKTELRDDKVKRSIESQALQEANSILRRFQKEPNEEIRIIKVLHLKFSVFDL